MPRVLTGLHSSLVFVDEGAAHWSMLDPLIGAVGYGMAGQRPEEPHLPFGVAERRWPRRWLCGRTGRPPDRLLAARFVVGQPVQLCPGCPEVISELPVNGTPGVARGVPHRARGSAWAAIVPREFAQALEADDVISSRSYRGGAGNGREVSPARFWDQPKSSRRTASVLAGIGPSG